MTGQALPLCDTPTCGHLRYQHIDLATAVEGPCTACDCPGWTDTADVRLAEAIAAGTADPDATVPPPPGWIAHLLTKTGGLHPTRPATKPKKRRPRAAAPASSSADSESPHQSERSPLDRPR